MQIIALNEARAKVPRPTLKTPSKGSAGDLCHEEQAPQTEIKRIMERYAGRLEEMLAWRSQPLDFCDCTNSNRDLQDLIEDVRGIGDKVSALSRELNLSSDDVIKLVKGDLTVLKKENNDHETESHQQEEKPPHFPQDSQSPAPKK